MHRSIRVRVLLSGCLALLAQPVVAQNPDVDLMAKWTAIAVVRYVVVGEFTGGVTVLQGPAGIRGEGTVTDRVEVTFDWNQNETALAGTPTFKNFPSKVSPTPAPGCPPARINGTYEYLDVVSVKQMSNVLELTGKRTYPGGAVPYTNEEGRCGAAWDEAAPKSEPVGVSVVVVPTVLFGMPSAGGPGTSISKDGKSIIVVEEGTGWTWTYTPTPVK